MITPTAVEFARFNRAEAKLSGNDRRMLSFWEGVIDWALLDSDEYPVKIDVLSIMEDKAHMQWSPSIFSSLKARYEIKGWQVSCSEGTILEIEPA